MIPPRVNRYDEGMYYGDHLDNALMVFGKNKPMRTDIALTICLNDCSFYEGGELVIQADATEQRFKGNSGDVIVYPAGLVHQVTPVTAAIHPGIGTVRGCLSIASRGWAAVTGTVLHVVIGAANTQCRHRCSQALV